MDEQLVALLDIFHPWIWVRYLIRVMQRIWWGLSKLSWLKHYWIAGTADHRQDCCRQGTRRRANNKDIMGLKRQLCMGPFVSHQLSH